MERKWEREGRGGKESKGEGGEGTSLTLDVWPYMKAFEILTVY